MFNLNKQGVPSLTDWAIAAFHVADEAACWKGYSQIVHTIATALNCEVRRGYDPFSAGSKCAVATVAEELHALRRIEPQTYAQLVAVLFALYRLND